MFDPFVLLYNKSLNDWSLGKQFILFPENLNVSRGAAEGNIEILGKQNELFPEGPVIKCLLLLLPLEVLRLVPHPCENASLPPLISIKNLSFWVTNLEYHVV